MEEEMIIAPKRTQGQFASRQAIESAVEIESASQSTDAASADLLRKLSDAFSCMDLEDVCNGVLQLSERFGAERAALHLSFRVRTRFRYPPLQRCPFSPQALA